MSNLFEKKKKVKCSPYNSMYVTMGDPEKDIEHFNKMAGTDDASLASTSMESAVDAVSGGEGVGLTEDRIFAPKAESYYELPDQIKIIDKSKVSEFIGRLQPGEEFEVGYVTPVYFYKKLEKFFTLIKCTEFIGCTGIDFWDMSTDKKEAPKDRVAKSTGQIADPLGKTKYLDHNGSEFAGEKGTDWSNSEVKNLRVSHNSQNKHKYYSDINKTVLQDDHIIYEYTPDGKLVTDENGNPQVAETITDLKTILFYPKKGTRPTVHYFLDLKNGEGYIECDRDTIEEVIYDKVVELTKQGLFDKKLDPHEDMTDDERAFVGSLMDKVNKVITTDAQTIDDRVFTGNVKRPDCRALYTNQIYYLAASAANSASSLILGTKLNNFTESCHLDEAKRYVRRYYIRPQNIFCSNKKDIIKALIDIDDQDCTIYTLNNLGDEKDVTKLTDNDIIYKYKDEILFDKNGIKVMDYDLYIKHEENRDKLNINTASDSKFEDVYRDRITDADLVADDDNIKRNGANTGTVKEELNMDNSKLVEATLTESKKFVDEVAEKMANTYAAGVTPVEPQVYAQPGENARDLLKKLADSEAIGIANFNTDWGENGEGREIVRARVERFKTNLNTIMKKINQTIKYNMHNYKYSSGYTSPADFAYDILRLECHYDTGKRSKTGTGNYYLNAAYMDSYVRAAEPELKRAERVAQSIYDMDQDITYILTNSLSATDREEIKSWFSNPATGVSSMVFKLPKIDDASKVANITFNRAKALRDRWAQINNKFFFNRFGANQPVEGTDFEYRNANVEPEKINGNYYSYWKPACNIYLHKPVSEAPESVKTIVNNAFTISREHGTNVDSSKNGNHLSNFYLGISLCALFGNGSDEYNIDFYAKKTSNEADVDTTTTANQENIDNENPLDQKFPDINAYGEEVKVESLKEAVEAVCCICGEPLDSYGNNAEPYTKGKCCDACNLKFVIPARLAQAEIEKSEEE